MGASAAARAGTLRLAVAGCGTLFERYYLPALARSNVWNLVGACDPSAARRQWLQHAWRGLVVCERLSQLLEVRNLDALFILTPPDTHYRLGLEALDAGLHVLVEKPMALNAADAQRILEASRRAGRQLWVGFTRRFRAPYQALKTLLGDGLVREIAALRCHMCFTPVAWGAVTGYLGDESKGGGVLHDVASHQVDLLAWLLGQPIEAVRVREGSAASRVTYDLRFVNGLVAQCVAEHGQSYREHLEVALPGRTVAAHAAGVLQSRHLPAAWAEHYGRVLTRLDGIARRVSGRPNVTSESFAMQCAAFAAALRGGNPFPRGADARDGAASVRAIDACSRALPNPGTWVPLLPE